VDSDMPLNPPGQKIFDSDNLFSIYRNGEKLILNFHFQNADDMFPPKMMVFNPQSKSSFLYTYPPKQAKNPYLPPLRPLMLFLLSQGRGVMLHACGIDDNGCGILFIGPSGSGKSTLANLWKDKKGVKILNDELVIIRKREECFWIYGTPWHGAPWPGNSQLYSAGMCPLKKIFFIKPSVEKFEENIAMRKKDIDSIAAMLPQSFPQYWDASCIQFNIDFLAELIRETQCYELDFMPNENIIDFVRIVA
jgi:hypothetical protein